ncbi:7alpha-cephem-methoxylase p8 chain related [Fusarium circinatum]|uniref:7alpha-cephem-methoxylase p8 chain related n=1 Tax=Fusarium circinatum TaxID=48490 RepID=A0A8H5UCJ1_FUSCI|nr:7alpha-cephem-methoxylase p8 chain related [Fusarium circinatum]
MASSPTIQAKVAYMKPDDELFRREKPYVSLVPFVSHGGKFTNTTIDEHMMKIENIRGRETDFSLDKNGFTYVSYNSKEKPTHDILSPSHPYMQEMANFLKAFLGANEVTVYDGSTRKVGDPKFLQASLYAHVDHTVANCRWRVKQLMQACGKKMPKHWAITNIWAPIKGPIMGSPLAVCDYQSLDRNDLVAVDSVFPHKVMEVYYVKHNPIHQWYYLQDQNVNEVLIMKTCDSNGEKSSCCAHSAVMPDPGANVVRESIEARFIVEY